MRGGGLASVHSGLATEEISGGGRSRLRKTDTQLATYGPQYCVLRMSFATCLDRASLGAKNSHLSTLSRSVSSSRFAATTGAGRCGSREGGARWLPGAKLAALVLGTL